MFEPDDFDDLLGGSTPEPDEEPLTYAQGRKRVNESMTIQGSELVMRGVTEGWLATVLGIGRTTVRRKLEGVEPKKVLGNNTKLYDVRECLPYLVPPHDLKQHLMRMNPKDLPERLRKEFWSSRKAEQDVRLRSKDLWLSADVHRVLGDLMKLIKDSVTLWTDTIDESVGLSSEQVDVLDDLARKLLTDFAGAVGQYIENGVTPSQEVEFEEDDDEEA